MGAALIVKPAGRRHFSVLVFGIAQVAMDIEPMIGMMRGWNILHGPSHTTLGALPICAVVAWLSQLLCNFILLRETLHNSLVCVLGGMPI